jgi:hypothetical protein
MRNITQADEWGASHPHAYESGEAGMNLLGRYAIPTDVFVDRLTMLLIVTRASKT